ncbi:MAG: hypothetical protein IJI78_06115 [Oscillospiraceae bacterium]|nr:hypothetical protein [Oscillospiraceae bacterium]
MGINEQKIKKEYKKSTWTLYAGLILLAATLLSLVLGVIKYSSSKNNVPDLETIIVEESDNKTRRIAYLDIDGCFGFASKDDVTLYIAYNPDYYYIISMDEKAIADLRNRFDQAADDELVRVYGWTIAIPEEAKAFAVEALNEELGEEVVGLDNFERMFGDVCLSVHPKEKVFSFDGFVNVSGGYFIASLFMLAGGLIMFFMGKTRKKTYEAAIKGEDLAMAEIDSPSAVCYEKSKTILTDNYLVSYSGSYGSVSFADIVWAYITRHSTNAVHDYDYLSVATKNGKLIGLANGSVIGKRQEETYNRHMEILNRIHEKNPEAKIGYSPENLAEFTQLQKEIKEKKKAGLL